MRQRRKCQHMAIVRAHYSPGRSGIWEGARGELEEAEGPGSQGLGVRSPFLWCRAAWGAASGCSPFLAPALCRS